LRKISKPPKLKLGDTIGIIAPGGPVIPSLLNRGIRYLKNCGYDVQIGKFIYEKRGYLAGNDADRVNDFHDMLSDPLIKAIIFARGGYGSLRLLPLINYNLIRQNPKILVGFSDITALQFAVLRKTRLVTFSGPMAAVDFGETSVNEATGDHLWSVLSGEDKANDLYKYNSGRLNTLHPGRAKGPLICGCLTVIASCVGTRYCPDFTGAILVLEDIGEEPYKLDRAVTTLNLHGVFDRISALVLGSFVNCNGSKDGEKNITIYDIIKPITEGKDIPTLINLSYGHIPEKLTLPVGVSASIDTADGTFVLDEFAVN